MIPEFLNLVINWLSDFYTLSAFIFVLIIISILIKDRKKVEREFIVFMRRTEKGRNFLDKIANKNPKFWKYLGSASVFVCFGVMIYGVYYLFERLYTSMITQAGPALSLVIPFPSKEPVFGYGYLGVPFWYWIIPVATVLLVHEGLHGVMMRMENVKIKSLGWVFLAVIPGAFVEPDEENLNKKNWKTKLRVYAGGSTGNFILFIFAWLGLTFLITPTFYTTAVMPAGYINATHYNQTEPFPAQKAELKGPILSINEERIHSLKDLQKIMNKTRPGEVISVETPKKTYSLKLASDPKNKNRGFMGVSFNENWKTNVLSKGYRTSNFAGLIEFIQGLVLWIMILNLGIGVFNLLPLKPLDGGLMIEALSEKFLPNYKGQVVRFTSAFILTLILATFLFPMF